MNSSKDNIVAKGIESEMPGESRLLLQKIEGEHPSQAFKLINPFSEELHREYSQKITQKLEKISSATKIPSFLVAIISDLTFAKQLLNLNELSKAHQLYIETIKKLQTIMEELKKDDIGTDPQLILCKKLCARAYQNIGDCYAAKNQLKDQKKAYIRAISFASEDQKFCRKLYPRKASLEYKLYLNSSDKLEKEEIKKIIVDDYINALKLCSDDRQLKKAFIYTYVSEINLPVTQEFETLITDVATIIPSLNKGDVPLKPFEIKEVKKENKQITHQELFLEGDCLLI